jgi:DNA invertase Pin-like site-specific DNA recombinase
MSAESRLGREAIETAYALKQLITAGVRVFFYLEDRERTFDSPTDKLLMSVTALAEELERQQPGSGYTTRCPGRHVPGT